MDLGTVLRPYETSIRLYNVSWICKVLHKECQIAFDVIKNYLCNPLMLVTSWEGSPLLLYFSVSNNSFGCVLGQHDETGKKERPTYYISKKFTPYESRYTLLERKCCDLTWIYQKLRHYLSPYTIYLISRMDPSKYIFWRLCLSKSLLNGRYFRVNFILCMLLIRQ